MAARTVVILGAGVGGLTAANELRRRLSPQHRIVLVDRESDHLFTPSLLWLMTGARRRAQLTKDVRRMVRPGIELVLGEVRELDPAGGRVIADGRDLRYDELIVALGAELAPEAFPGFAAGARSFFDLEGAAGLRTALETFAGGRLAVMVTSLPYKCPAAPYEAALLIDDLLRRRGVRGRSEIALYTPEPQPMPVAGPALGAAVTALLRERDIAYHPSRPPRAIDADAREIVFSDGTRERFDLLAAVPPHRPPAVVKASPLANEAGWAPVDPRTLRTRSEHVYALGDVTAIALPNGKLLPKAGVFAHAEALAVAESVAAELGAGRPATFDGTGYCWVELGGGRAAFASGDFYAAPDPRVALRRPGRLWHVGKVAFERYWLGEGVVREAAAAVLRVGGRVLGVSVALS